MDIPHSTLAFSSILAAHRRIAPFVRRTPLVRSGYLSELAEADVWLKLECGQPTGSFKVRGAANKIGSLSAAQRAQGLVTGSAGNHGLGVAYASQALGVTPADIFVPATAPRAKVDKLRRFAVHVHETGQTYEEAHQAATAFASASGALYVPAYDDTTVIAGQGTIALEVLADLPTTGAILVPVGGGGLVAGIAVAAKTMAPGCRVIGLQPEASPAALLSFRDGIAYDPYDNTPTIADGLAGGFGAVPFAVARGLVDEVRLASEAELRRAVCALVSQEQIIAEPSGAIAVTPLLRRDPDMRGQTVVCVISGGNLDARLLRDILVEFDHQ